MQLTRELKREIKSIFSNYVCDIEDYNTNDLLVYVREYNPTLKELIELSELLGTKDIKISAEDDGRDAGRTKIELYCSGVK